jgi:hypothetical protein
MVFRFQNALENARLAIQILLASLALLFYIILLLIWGWHSAQQSIRINIPPQIPVNGITLSADTVPAATVYSFAYYVWQGINHWSTDGAQDYKKGIE